MYPPKNDLSWMGVSAISLYIHKCTGLDGARCGYYEGPWTNIQTSFAWDSVTCQDCLKLKQEWEPMTLTIDTKGD